MVFTYGSLTLAGGIVTVNEILYHHRTGNIKYLADDVERTLSNYYKALSGLKDFLTDHGIYDACRKSFLNWAADFSIWFHDQQHIPLLHGLVRQQLKKGCFRNLDVYGLSEEEYYNHDFFERVTEFREELSKEDPVSNPPCVTVILPVLNAAGVLDCCLDRLVYQTLNNIEILIINDGSTDDSSEMIEKYAIADRRITVINNEKTRGHGAAINQGIKAARGECISIVEPFDLFDVTMLERLYNTVRENDLDFAKGDIAKLKHDKYGNLEIEYRMLAIHKGNYDRVIDSSSEHVWKDFRHLPYCAVYSKSFLEKNGILFKEGDEATFTDEEFVFKTDISAKRVMYVLETLYYDVRKSYLFSGYPMTELL